MKRLSAELTAIRAALSLSSKKVVELRIANEALTRLQQQFSARLRGARAIAPAAAPTVTPGLAVENENLRMEITRLNLEVEDMQKKVDALRQQQHKPATSGDAVAAPAPTEQPGKIRLGLQ